METLVRLSFYCFAAATFALVASAACYLAYAVGRVRLRQRMLTTNAGTTLVAHEASLEPAALGVGRFATLLAWFGVGFQATPGRVDAQPELPVLDLEFGRNGGAAELLGMANAIDQRVFARSEVRHQIVSFVSRGPSVGSAGQREQSNERD